MKHAHGQYMELHWEDDVEAYHVRGHVSEAEFWAALALPAGSRDEILGATEVVGWEDHKPVHRQVRWSPVLHAYGRWSCEPREDGPGHVLREHAQPGRGRFPVTMIVRVFGASGGPVNEWWKDAKRAEVPRC